MSNIVLHNYYRSSTSYRVRIALEMKGLSYGYVSHHLRHGEHLEAGYLAVNPQGLVPALVLDDGTLLTQSLAIIEYLDEIQPAPLLLPEDPLGRARVRMLAQRLNLSRPRRVSAGGAIRLGFIIVITRSLGVSG